MAIKRIEDFLNNVIKQGLSYNNEYSFSFLGKNEVYDYLKGVDNRNYESVFKEISNINDYLNDAKLDKSKLSALCEEISLPGVNSATGTAEGIFTGVNFKYAHTKTYNDLSISFIVDRDFRTMKFFQYWYDWIFEGEFKEGRSIDSKQTYKLNYYDSYCLDMIIVKGETKAVNSQGNGLIPVSYKLINAYPVNISSVPLNTGASSVTRFSVTLAYERWVFQANPSENQKLFNTD